MEVWNKGTKVLTYADDDKGKASNVNQHSGRVFVVTGANRGIGKATVEALCEQASADDVVYLTARNVSFGEYAMAELKEKGLSPQHYTLDISERPAIEEFRDVLVERHGGLDVLINNAGVSTKPAEINIENNFHGTLLVCEILFPILRAHARVVHLSSRAGPRAFVGTSDEMKEKFADPMLDMEGLKQLMSMYMTSLRSGTVKKDGFLPNCGYGMSKLAIAIMGMIQQRELDTDPSNTILVSSCCPGSVQTDLTLFKGKLTPQEACQQTVVLAMREPDYDGLRGQFHEMEQVIPFLEKKFWRCRWLAGATGVN